MQLFYLKKLIEGDCVLDAEESKHCVQILRHKAGDWIAVTNGIGQTAQAEITNANPNRCVLKISSIVFNERPEKNTLHIAFAPTKSSDRTEWFIEKATEFGVAKITFIKSRYSERDKINLDRYRKVALSAMKQSLRCYLPNLVGVLGFDEFIDTYSNNVENKFIAHCNTKIERAPFTTMFQEKAGEIIVMIGPEGDFSETEIQKGLGAGFSSVHIGGARLRAETAAVAVSSFNYFEGIK